IRAVQIGMSLLAVLLVYDSTRRLFDGRAGLVAAGILALWFPFVELPIHLFSEPLFLYLLIGHLWLLLLWRDMRRWWLLALAGLLLGLAALARSPALYSAPFVALWLLLELRPADVPLLSLRVLRGLVRPAFLRAVALVGLCCALTIAPWTIRNYLEYQRFIPIDTIGPANLWLIVGDHNRQGSEILLSMPQAERQSFATAEARRLLAEDPQRFVGLLFNGWERNFREIWKLQYVVDFFGQNYFYMRPLRELAPLGLLGELLWLAFVGCGLAALAAPLAPREGAFRVLALGWLGYTCLSIMILHPEPRYSYPIWLLLAMYGAAALAHPAVFVRQFRGRWLHTAAALLLVGGFLLLALTTRDYPRLIGNGVQRERHFAAGRQAYAAGDTVAAVREMQAALTVQPEFVEGRAYLALLQIEQGNLDAARALLREGDAQELDIARGMLAYAAGDAARAADLLRQAEVRRSADMQAFSMMAIDPPATSTLHLGTGLDLGYIRGFSPAEELANGERYRWLEAGTGSIVLPLAAPLDTGSVVLLRLTAGRPEGARLRVQFGPAHRETITVGDGWRVYRLLVPADLEGQETLTLALDGDTFMPAHRFPGSTDLRLLSVMVDAVQVVQTTGDGQ
ncbi:MAG: tetratricopeptide repeat protein, partial [Blastochloris sp.]|nr:tetratricopeptide repeat protein [Blastochloris sp.]